MKKALALISLLVAGSTQAVTTTDNQAWVPVNLLATVGDDWRAFLELQPRFTEDLSTLGTFIVRPAFGRALSPNATVWLGYAMVASAASGGGYSVEHTPWQGFYWRDVHAERLIWEARNRLEERFLPGNGVPSIRWRTRLRVEYILAGGAGPLSVIASDEVFFNLNTNPNNPRLPAGFSQNRAYAGMGYRFAPLFQLETGYLHQLVPGRGGAATQSNNVWLTNLNFNFGF